jgi:transposase
MSYIEIKVIKGREYRYERTSYRVGGTVKHRSRYLGAVRPAKAKRNPNAGRKPKLFIRQVTDEERRSLEQNLRNGKSFVKDRARILIASLEGNTVKQIGAMLGIHRPRIEKVIKQFNKVGIKVFTRGKSTGRPRRITREQRALLLQYANTDPRKLGLHFTTWSRTRLAAYAATQGIVLSPSRAGGILKEEELHFKNKRPHLYSNDPDFAKKNSSGTRWSSTRRPTRS